MDVRLPDRGGVDPGLVGTVRSQFGRPKRIHDTQPDVARRTVYDASYDALFRSKLVCARARVRFSKAE